MEVKNEKAINFSKDIKKVEEILKNNNSEGK